MYTSVLYQSLVLKPQYQISGVKMLYLEEQMKPKVEIEMINFNELSEEEELESELEIEENDLIFGEEEFKRILENHYTSEKFFDTEEEWEMIIKENTQVDSDYEQYFDSDTEGDYSDEEYEV